MRRFSLELLYHIVGIGSASGLFYKNGSIFIASDNAGYLYEFNTADNTLSSIQLLDSETLFNIPKKQKPDFEALAEKDKKLYLFGSGSTDKRNIASVVDLESHSVSRLDLSELYARMRAVSKIDEANFNLEGALAKEDDWLFFQRGNGNSGSNGIFKVSGDLTRPSNVVYSQIQLPKIKQVQASFTDAVLAQDAIWFLATAEDSGSTYEDGDVLGSLIGKMDAGTFEIVFSEEISPNRKFEGLSFYEATDTQITFLLCEDNDTDAQESEVFKLKIEIE